MIARFRHTRAGRWAWRGLEVLVVIALLSDVLANDRPLIARLDGTTYFPAFHGMLVDLGWAQWDAELVNARWDELSYDFVLRAPVPYAAPSTDFANANYVGPFDDQDVPSLRWRHWLGTDQLGRDVLAGMISGTRVALLVGLISMGIATLLGGLLGALAGFFGDDRLRTSWVRIGLNGVAFFLIWLWCFEARAYANANGGWSGSLLLGVLLLVGANGLAWLAERRFPGSVRVRFPVDLIVMRLVEIFNAVPGLLLLLTIVALLERSTIFYVMLIIGVLRWTAVARFLRAEMLRVREMEYITAARVLGFSQLRILFRHALPNAVGPVLIVVSFGIASAVLLEAALSFIGIGVGETITWGKLLAGARLQVSAWWLAVFPGLGIFFTVLIFNLLGDALSENR